MHLDVGLGLWLAILLEITRNDRSMSRLPPSNPYQKDNQTPIDPRSSPTVDLIRILRHPEGTHCTSPHYHSGATANFKFSGTRKMFEKLNL
jgi:hypothetical protein